MRLPTFLVIGAQKSGTKWLYHNLSQHPDIYVADGGGCYEVHYLNSEHYGDVRWWASHFVPAKRGETSFGDITPDYAICDSRRVAHAYRFCPDAKLIYTLRNPKQRAISHLRMIHSKTIRDYKGEPRGPMIRVTDDLERWVDYFEFGPGRHHGEYSENIDRWLEAYSREQMLLLDYSELKKTPAGYLNRVFAFLGVPSIDLGELPIQSRFHVSEPHPVPQELLPHLDRIFDPGIKKLSEYVSFDVSGWLLPVIA